MAGVWACRAWEGRRRWAGRRGTRGPQPGAPAGARRWRVFTTAKSKRLVGRPVDAVGPLHCCRCLNGLPAAAQALGGGGAGWPSRNALPARCASPDLQAPPSGSLDQCRISARFSGLLEHASAELRSLPRVWSEPLHRLLTGRPVGGAPGRRKDGGLAAGLGGTTSMGALSTPDYCASWSRELWPLSPGAIASPPRETPEERGKFSSSACHNFFLGRRGPCRPAAPPARPWVLVVEGTADLGARAGPAGPQRAVPVLACHVFF